MVSHSSYLYFITFLSLQLFSLATAMDSDRLCTLRHGDNLYDLNPLSSKKDYELETEQGHTFILNVCRSMARDTWNVKGRDESKVAGVLRNMETRGDLSIGEYNTTIKWSHTHLQLLFTNGSPCGNSTDDALRASTVVEFRCDHSKGHVGTPRLLAQLPPDDGKACGFFVEWRTSYACPVYESSMGFFSILFVTIGSILALYLVVGTLHNRFVLGLSGYDQIPQFSLSSMRYHGTEAYHWVRDYASGYQRPPFAGAAAYQAAPTNNDEEAFVGGFRRPSQHGSVNSSINPFSHQSQVSGGDIDGAVPSPGSGGFTRPSTAGKARAPPANTNTNPVSHQTQFIAEAAAQNQSSPTSRAASPGGLKGQQLQSRRLEDKAQPDAPQTEKEGKDFMLGDDDEEEEDESQGEDAQPQKQGKGSARVNEGTIRL